MKTKKDIYKELKLNRLTTWLVVLSCTCISLYAINVVNKSKKLIYSYSEKKNLAPLEVIEEEKAEEILQKSHIKLFVENFYQYDQWNYKENIETALWLIDSEIGKKIIKYYEERGHFNRMIQSNSSQKVKNVESKINEKGEFILSCIIEINKPNQINKNSYNFKAKGTIEQVSRDYPLNPFGYLITDFVEISNIKNL